MKRLLALSLLGSSFLLIGSNPAKADTNFHFVQNGAEGDEIYRSTVNNGITSFEFITKHSVEIDPINALETESYWYDESLNKLFFQEYSSPGVYTGKHAVYDLNENTWTSITISSDNGNTQYPYLTIPTSNSDSIASNTSNISTNTSNIKNLGEGVAGSTALTAALTALPQTSKESKLSCGVGTGAYSSRYAVGFGCASKVNERVDINAGGSYVFGGSKSYGGGTLDSGVLKAGFVFKLGKLNKSVQISMKDKKVMETKIGTLTDENEKLQNKVSTLMARLERLEKIASRDIKSQDLALIKN